MPDDKVKTPPSFVPDTQGNTPASFIPDSGEQPPEQKSLLGNLWGALNEGLVSAKTLRTAIEQKLHLAPGQMEGATEAAIKQGQPGLAQARSLVSGITQSTSQVGSALTSPLSLGLAAASGGASLLPKTATLARAALAVPELAAGGAFAAQGAQQTFTPQQPGESDADYAERLLMGTAQMAGGAAGIGGGGKAMGRSLKSGAQRVLGIKENISDVVAQRRSAVNQVQAGTAQALANESGTLHKAFQSIENRVPDPVMTKGELQGLINDAVAEKGVIPSQVPGRVYESVGKPGKAGVEAAPGSAAEGVLSALTPERMAQLPPELQSMLSGGASEALSFAQLRDVYHDLFRASRTRSVSGDLKAGLIEARAQLGDKLQEVADQAGFGKEYKQLLGDYHQHMNEMGSALVDKFLKARGTQARINLLNNADNGARLRGILQKHGVDLSPYTEMIDKGLLPSRIPGLSDEAEAVSRGEYGLQGMKALRVRQIAAKSAGAEATSAGTLYSLGHALSGSPYAAAGLLARIGAPIAMRFEPLLRTLTKAPEEAGTAAPRSIGKPPKKGGPPRGSQAEQDMWEAQMEVKRLEGLLSKRTDAPTKAILKRQLAWQKQILAGILGTSE